MWIKIANSKIQLVRLIPSLLPVLSFFALLNFNSTLNAQSGIKGHIVDKVTNEPLAGALIKIGEKGGLTDLNGFFQVPLNPGHYQAEVSYLGYQTYNFNFIVSDSIWFDLNVFLEIQIGILGTIVISDSRYNKPLAESSNHNIHNLEKIKNIPMFTTFHSC